jgi:hypothetical protein
MSFSTISYVSGTPTIFTLTSYKNSGSIPYLSLGEGWTSIEKSAFNRQHSLIAIKLPSSLTSIGEAAFSNAANLNSVTFNNFQTSLLTNIGSQAFYKAIRLTQITIPATVTSIGDSAFPYTGLTQVTIPANVTNIASMAFEYVSTLTSITFATGSKLATIGGYQTFNGAINLTQINIPASVTKIGARSFSNTTSLTQITVDVLNNNYSSDSFGVLFNKTKTELIQYPRGNTRTSYTIPTSVKIIKSSAFNGVSTFTSINIPSTVTNIESYSLSGMSNVSSFTVNSSNQYYSTDTFGVLFDISKKNLIEYPFNSNSTTYTIPNTVTSILDGAFSRLTKLTSLSIDSTNTNYSTDGGVLFDKNKKILIQYPIGNTQTSYIIPASVTSLGGTALIGASHLTSITFPASCKYSEWAGYSMTSLTNIIVNASTGETQLTVVDDVLFNKNSTILYKYPSRKIGSSYIMPSSVTEIGAGAFDGAIYLNTLTISKSLSSFKYRNENMFKTSGLTNLIIDELDDNYREVGISIGTNQTFYGKSNVTVSTNPSKINIKQSGVLNKSDIDTYLLGITAVNLNVSISDSTSIGNAAFKDNLNIEQIRIPYTVSDIGIESFRGMTNLNTITIDPNSYLNRIQDSVFQGASKLTTFAIPNQVTSIGANAFKDASSLTSITFSTNILTSILDSTFQGASKLTAIEIPYSVASIGANAFKDTSSLTSITFAQQSSTGINHLTRILDSAFQGASKLTTIEIPSKVISIGANAFNGASNLTSITFAQNSKLTTIGDYAFQGASKLTSITIPKSVTSIGTNFFTGSSIKTVIFAENNELTTIGDYAFQGVSLLSIITIPASVTSIGANAFTGSSITTVIFEESTLLDGVTTPGSNRTLYGKTGLTVSHITKVFTGSGQLNGVTNASLNGATRARLVGYTSIGIGAFTGVTNLTHVTIPPSITYIEQGLITPAIAAVYFNFGPPIGTLLLTQAIPENVAIAPAFHMCTNLKNIIFESSTSLTTFGLNVGTVSNFRGATNLTVSIITKVFNGSGQLLSAYLNLLGATKVIIQKYSSIGANAFYGAKTIEYVTIPLSVTRLAAQSIFNCINLKSITFESGSKLKEIGGNALLQCESLISFTIPESVTRIESFAFNNCTSLTSITIPESVTSIGSNIFLNSGIKTIIFNTSNYLNTIGLTSGQGKNIFGATNVNVLVNTQIFKGLGELTNAASYFLGENPSKFAVIEDYNTIGVNAFKNATGLQAIDILSRLTVIKDSAFESTTSLTEIAIPYSVSIIGQNAFKGSGIKSITINSDTPSLLTDISNYAFADCSGLTQITIPNLVTSIGSYAFSNATSLTRVTLPNTITNIADHLFHGAIALTTINIPDSVTRIGEYAFTDCSALRQLVISVKVRRIDDFAFNNSSLTQIYIPANVTSIGISAFAGASQLTSVTFDPDCDVTSIGLNAFAGCSKLTVVKMNHYDIDSLIASYPSSISLNSNGTIFTKFFGATNVTFTDNSPSSTPICFPKGTPVNTNQGNIAIELLNPDIHTIRNKRIIAITQSRPLHKYIVSIEKDALGSNIPNAKTQISKEHKVYYKGEMIKAKDLVSLCNGVTKIPYTGETLYNVLMEKHDKMMINNLICETLHPDNILAKIHNGKYTSDEKNKLYRKLTELIESGDEPAYNKFYATLR